MSGFTTFRFVAGRWSCLFIFMTLGVVVARAQDKELVQVKTFDSELKPFQGLEVSINGSPFLSVGTKAVGFIELDKANFPIRAIRIKNDQYEAASWNYTKGVLEVVVRKKNYRLESFVFMDISGKLLSATDVTYAASSSLVFRTSEAGKIEVPVPLGEPVPGTARFSIPQYHLINMVQEGAHHVIRARHVDEIEKAKKEKSVTRAEPVPVFDVAKLDSAQSLIEFYNLIKSFSVGDMDETVKQKIDDRFNALVAALRDSTALRTNSSIEKISDSSYVSDDIRYLLQQATQENETLQNQRSEFNDKIKLITDKLSSGVSNLDESTRSRLLTDLAQLEQLLSENESRFSKNQSDYRQVINTLKEKYFDYQNLETRLTESETQRLADQVAFRQKIIWATVLVIVFGLLIILLIYFSQRLQRQKKELVAANEEVRSTNENLEEIVANRTRMLADANQELDTFLYRASHDLRSPVRSIMGLCHIAPYLSPEEFVRRVEGVVVNMDGLLKKLSTVSEINHPGQITAVAVADLLRSVFSKFDDQIIRKQVQFHIDCPSDLTVQTNPDLLEIILNNLIENSLLYGATRSDGHSRIEIMATKENDHLLISVYDNGQGIENSILPRLFDMFFKGSETSQGHGLGLYIVQKSLQALGGSITIQSEPRRFTRFTLRVPSISTAVSANHRHRLLKQFVQTDRLLP